MALPQHQPQQQPVTLEVLAYQLKHLQEGLDRLLLRMDATEARVRVLEDDRLAARTVLGVGSLLGVGGLGVLVKHFFLT